jgi:hypothetical protein
VEKLAQYTAAQKIFDHNDHALEGLIDFRFQRAIMVNCEITAEGGEVLRTAPAAGLGYSFPAGK